MNTEPTNARFCYLEIPAPRLTAAMEFYRTVFGWKVEVSALGHGPYASFEAGTLSGGLDPVKAPSEEGVLLYLEVDGIPDRLERIEEAGGVIRTPRAPALEGREEYGYIATFLDPNGNRMGLWSRT